MRQQINLYQSQFRPDKRRFSSFLMMKMVGGAITAFAAIMAYGAWDLYSERAELRELEEEQQTALGQIRKFSEHIAARQTDKRLVEQIDALEKALDYRQRVQAVLQQDMFGPNQGYSNYFIALAKQDVQGLWLNGISISGAGHELTLKGATVAADLVPQYLQKFSSDPVLGGMLFYRFQLNRPAKEEQDKKEAHPPLEFMISTARNKDETGS